MAKYLRAAPMFSPLCAISLPSWPSITLAELNTATRRTRSPDSTLSSSMSTCSGDICTPDLASASRTSLLAPLISSRLAAMRLLVSSTSRPRLSTVSVRMPGSMRVLRRRQLPLAQLDDALLEVADVLAPLLDLLLHVDDGHVGDDAHRGVEQVADLLLAVLARLGPQRRQQELVLRRQLPGVGAILGGVLQDGVDRRHQAARLLVGGIALARIALGRRGGLGLGGRRSALCDLAPRCTAVAPDDVADRIATAGLRGHRGSRGQSDDEPDDEPERDGRYGSTGDEHGSGPPTRRTEACQFWQINGPHPHPVEEDLPAGGGFDEVEQLRPDLAGVRQGDSAGEGLAGAGQPHWPQRRGGDRVIELEREPQALRRDVQRGEQARAGQHDEVAAVATATPGRARRISSSSIWASGRYALPRAMICSSRAGSLIGFRLRCRRRAPQGGLYVRSSRLLRCSGLVGKAGRPTHVAVQGARMLRAAAAAAVRRRRRRSGGRRCCGCARARRLANVKPCGRSQSITALRSASAALDRRHPVVERPARALGEIGEQLALPARRNRAT